MQQNGSKEEERVPPLEELIYYAGGEVDASKVTLRFQGDNIDLEEITRMLGQAPTSAHRKGDPNPNSRKGHAYARGVWCLSTGEREHTSLEEQLVALFERLPGDPATWRYLTRKYQADLFCGIWLKTWNRGFELSPEVIQKIAERGLKIGFDIYYEGDF